METALLVAMAAVVAVAVAVAADSKAEMTKPEVAVVVVVPEAVAAQVALVVQAVADLLQFSFGIMELEVQLLTALQTQGLVGLEALVGQAELVEQVELEVWELTMEEMAA